MTFFITNEKLVLVRFIRVVKFIYFKTKALASASAFFNEIEDVVKCLLCKCYRRKTYRFLHSKTILNL